MKVIEKHKNWNYPSNAINTSPVFFDPLKSDFAKLPYNFILVHRKIRNYISLFTQIAFNHLLGLNMLCTYITQ